VSRTNQRGGEELTCRQIVDFLMDYLDGELPADASSTFEEHLAICPPCRVYLDTYEETIRLGREACADHDDPADAPEELIQAILAAR